ncbi:response regulator [Parvularcula sp. LCG005]|uniref:response regulator n=1 Tax=Parvularcula sp. LCG005 TaxID=3078805 RepID=UPI0029432F1E|nr:response regulator [Parvularcula sp. LCG005]WOI53018.1 response regulator [Parvularcula sp. LCG005]
MKRPTILIVEDEALVGLALAEKFEDSGYGVMGPFASVEETLQAVTASRPDAALLDMNLGYGDTSEPIAEWLASADIPFAFLTGYSELKPSKEWLKTKPFLSKPVDPDRAVAEAERLLTPIA